MNTTTNQIAIAGSSLGLIIGLGYAFNKQKGFWAYIGYGLLGSVVLGTAAGLVGSAVNKQ